MSEGTVHYHAADGVGYVTIDRPQRRNAMTAALSAALLDAVEQAADDEDARVVVVRAEGDHFCVGADLGGGGSEGSSPRSATATAIERTLRVPMRTSELLHTMPKPTIAAVQGAAAGAGFGVALACDLRILADDAVLRTAFLPVALSGDFGSTWLLTRLVGPAKARELFFRNPKVSAAEADALGLATRVVPRGDVRAAADELARELAAAAPLALSAMKANLNDALEVGFQDALAREARRQAALYFTSDVAEAARAFVEKRTPRFTGE